MQNQTSPTAQTSHNHKVVAQLKPTKLWNFFATLSNIPRVSRQEKGVCDWLTQFAMERNLDYKIDAIGNFFIYKARQNSDSDKTVLLQQHMDMVCEKDLETNFDFETDSIVLRKDGDYIYASNTTLGSDNGIGLVATLCILDDLETPHPKIEAVFTMNEESGMDGIMNLDKSLISADYVLNLDTEEEGSVYISSAGSRDLETVIKPLVKLKTQKALQIKITGMRGGHSGVNIGENRLNSNKVLGIILGQIQSEILLCDINGGSKRNAIPRNSQAIIVPKILENNRKNETNPANLPNKIKSEIGEIEKTESQIGGQIGTQSSKILITNLQKRLEIITKQITHNYQNIEPNIKIEILETVANSHFDSKTSDQIIHILASIHSGVWQMSHIVSNLVQTSNNLGVIQSENGKIKIINMVRSSDDFELKLTVNQILSIIQSNFGVNFEPFGKARTELKFESCENTELNEDKPDLQVFLSETTSGWKAEKNNILLDKFQQVHTQITGQNAEIKAIHAGLECGFLKDYLPNSNVISFGPQIEDAHSPKEHVKISSVEEFYRILQLLLVSL